MLKLALIRCAFGLVILLGGASPLLAAAEKSVPPSEPDLQRAEGATVFVLPPQAAATVQRFLAIGTPTSTGLFFSASLQRDHVVIQIQEKGKSLLHVRLVHPSVAPKKARRIGNMSLVLAPGPAPAARVKELTARLKRGRAKLDWQKAVVTPDETEARGKEMVEDKAVIALAIAKEEAFRTGIARLLGKAQSLVELGRKDEALALLSGAEPGNDVGLRVAVAFATMRAGDRPGALARVAEVEARSPTMTLGLRLLRGKPLQVEKALQGVTPSELCEVAMVAQRARSLGKHGLARSLASQIRQAAPDCELAREVELLETSALKDPAPMESLLKAALARPKRTLSTLQIASDFYRAQGQNVRSIHAAMDAARIDPTAPGVMEGLARAMSVDPAVLPAIMGPLEKESPKGHDATVRAYTLGLAYLLGQNFRESQTWLLPLQKPLSTLVTLQVFLALGEFNLGRKAEAADRLMKLKVHGPQDMKLLYFRAEVTRDLNRPQALKDLRAFVAYSARHPSTTPKELARVTTLLKSLEGCAEAKALACEGPWHHPRTSQQAQGGQARPAAANASLPPGQPAAQKHGASTDKAAKSAAGAKVAPSTEGGEESPLNGEESPSPWLVLLLGIGLLVGFVLLRRQKI